MEQCLITYTLSILVFFKIWIDEIRKREWLLIFLKFSTDRGQGYGLWR